jgi:hypothetical protein
MVIGPGRLFIAGEVDHILPARLNRTNYERYRDSTAITEALRQAGAFSTPDVASRI